jgi:hypothetical protein
MIPISTLLPCYEDIAWGSHDRGSTTSPAQKQLILGKSRASCHINFLDHGLESDQRLVGFQLSLKRVGCITSTVLYIIVDFVFIPLLFNFPPFVRFKNPA